MKRLLYSVLIIFLVTTLFIRGCLDFSNDCDESEMPSISVSFSFFVQVKYNDNNFFPGQIEAVIYKKTCEGKMSGYRSNKGTLNQGWYCAGKFLYSFSNSEDKIHYKFLAYHTPFYPATEQTEVIEGSFSYAQIAAGKGDYDEIEKTFFITIPTDSEGLK